MACRVIEELDHGNCEREVGQNKDKIDEVAVPIRLIAGGVGEKNITDRGQQIGYGQES